jgi:hypothetical protein
LSTKSRSLEDDVSREVKPAGLNQNQVVTPSGGTNYVETGRSRCRQQKGGKKGNPAVSGM